MGHAQVGPGQRAYVIAEAGVNHNGCRTTALHLVDAARAAGADAVKFQAFRADELVTDDAATADYQREATGDTSQRQMLERLELTRDDFAALAEHCRRQDIEFLATPFSSTQLRMLIDLGIRAIKIASTDLTNYPLLDACAETGLPLILSTGAARSAELEATVAHLGERDSADRLILLHCVSSYPTAWEDANLRRVSALERRFGRPTGFSDHTASTETGALAVAAGACVVEKHFTLDASGAGPDQALSLEPAELREYVARIRHAEKALGTGGLDMQAVEASTRAVARRSVVAARPIRPGQTLTPDDLTVKRPGGGVDPASLQQLVGRQARTAIPADTRLAWEMLK